MCLCMLLIMIYDRFGVVKIESRVPSLGLVTVAVRSVVKRFSIA